MGKGLILLAFFGVMVPVTGVFLGNPVDETSMANARLKPREEWDENKEENEKEAAKIRSEETQPEVGAGEPQPMFTEETMPAVSPTLQCVMNLALQYFVVYTLLALIRTVNQFNGHAWLGHQKVLETACTTVTFAPMLSVLFLGARMRAIQLSQGQTEKYKLPQPWVQQAMFTCTYAVLAQVILVLLMPLFTGETEVKTDQDGNLDMSAMQGGGMVVTLLSVLRYMVMTALYGGFTIVCIGIFMMEGPKEIWGDSPPPVSPAVSCTMNLTTQFFVVYLLVALTKTAQEINGATDFLSKLQGLLTLAKYTVNFAPMLCILFIGARMRALQMDPKHGNPQPWAQRCFYLCAYSVLVQTVLVIVMPFCVECEVKQGSSEGDVVFIMENPTLGHVMTGVRYVALVALYGGFTAVIVSVFLIEHPKDPALTPPISPAMQCVMNLTIQYFFIYLVLFLSITAKQFQPDVECLGTVIAIMEAGQKTVMFAPMLSMLFIGARMRALQLTKATDGTIPPSAGPQGWAQDGMFLATWSVLVQVIMTILVPVVTGSAKPEMDEDGNVKTPEGANKWVGITIDCIRYLCLISMYGGAVTVMVAVFLMTPEDLPPYAERSTLVPGVAVPQPPTPPTPGF
eukprot:gnl/MRDRNA2_/MRDRNA2_94704_c0_seq1.p1 gnl/MRDRNA2_/MRDRNA2_94704_c0~~gnl/MRDRNA2_/MRDRNA2_94704_c0_seq1.p1  ORF type:complete len:626 (+),score=106.38 gnl/MRDRNA2_/MRDRNA2_94704_c0_seq1:142-2019(+)